MIIVAWNGSGAPTSIFEADVFKKVLSVFITAAILKLGQGNWSFPYFQIIYLIPDCMRYFSSFCENMSYDSSDYDSSYKIIFK